MNEINVSFNIDTGYRGSFRKIVKRGQKLMVEKFEGHHYSCSHVCKFQGGEILVKGEANIPLYSPPPPLPPKGNPESAY